MVLYRQTRTVCCVMSFIILRAKNGLLLKRIHNFIFFIFFKDFGTPISINPTDEAASGNSSSERNKVKKERLRSLDTFRGSVALFVDTCFPKLPEFLKSNCLLQELQVMLYLFVGQSLIVYGKLSAAPRHVQSVSVLFTVSQLVGVLSAVSH